MKMKKNKKIGVSKFLLGAGVGAFAAMLLTKNNGKENREQLKRKINDLLTKVKNIDQEELKNTIEAKVNDIVKELEDMDKEKALKIARKKAEEIKQKAEDLVEYTIEKGTPVLEKSANMVREKAIIVTKEILKKLEQEEK